MSDLPYPFDASAVRCPVCGTWHEQVGPEMVILHVVYDHPNTRLALEMQRIFGPPTVEAMALIVAEGAAAYPA